MKSNQATRILGLLLLRFTSDYIVSASELAEHNADKSSYPTLLTNSVIVSDQPSYAPAIYDLPIVSDQPSLVPSSIISDRPSPVPDFVIQRKFRTISSSQPSLDNILSDIPSLAPIVSGRPSISSTKSDSPSRVSIAPSQESSPSFISSDPVPNNYIRRFLRAKQIPSE
jgi:hypothetical protein